MRNFKKHGSSTKLCAAGFTETIKNSKTFCTKSDTNAGCSAMAFKTFGFYIFPKFVDMYSDTNSG